MSKRASKPQTSSQVPLKNEKASASSSHFYSPHFKSSLSPLRSKKQEKSPSPTKSSKGVRNPEDSGQKPHQINGINLAQVSQKQQPDETVLGSPDTKLIGSNSVSPVKQVAFADQVNDS